jgi:uncharacterized protein
MSSSTATNTVRWTRALVTGASSGIGWAIAKQLAQQGTSLVVVARDQAKLQELAEQVSVPCEILVADLSDRWQLAMVEDRLRSAAEPIDLLVNNAGFGFTGSFHELDVDAETAVVQVNITAVLRLAHAAASTMATRSGPRGILNVSSLAGFAATPTSATYGATKAFVTSFSEALHTELKPTGVWVSALCPGYTRTDFQRRANADEVSGKVPDRLWQTADAVAAAGLEGIAANKSVVVPGAHNKAAAGIASALPRRVTRAIVAAGAKQR